MKRKFVILGCLLVGLLTIVLLPSLAFAGGSQSTAEDGADEEPIDFVYIDSQEVAVGTTEYVVVSFNEIIDSGSALTLRVKREGDGKIHEFTSTKVVDDAALFELSFDGESTGVYSLISVCFHDGTNTERIIKLDSGENHGSFVVKPADSKPDLRDSGIETNIYGLDDDGSIINKDGLGETAPISPLSLNSSNRTGDFVIVLDAGHGGSDSGAVGNGIKESDINLKIARYCKEELEKYYGVKVIMTRDSDTRVGLEDRSAIARDAGADFFISFHINSGGGTGAEVWIPAVNDSWHSSFHEIGDAIGSDILSKLSALGLNNRGTKFDYYTLNGGRYYPDGSPADSLSVIRNCRLYGIPAILVEHGFIDRASDANILKDDNKLAAMGKADAEAIASFFGLSKEQRPVVEASWMRNGEIDLTWSAVDGAERYAVALKTESGYHTYTYDCTETSYTVTGLENGEDYQFLVQAYVDGHWTSFSNRDIFSCTLIPMPEARVESTGDGTVTLSWGAVDGAEAYAVAEYVGGRYVTYTLDCRDTTYTVSDLANGYEHSFLVQAKVGGRWSSFGPANLVKATPEGAMRPSVSAEPADRSVALTWDPVPGAERYAVAVREGSGWRTFTYDCRGTSYTATGLSNGTEYEFLVQALCMGRWSSFGEGDVVSVIPADPAAPEARVESTGDGTVTLSWGAVDGAEAYAVAEYVGGRYVTYTLDCRDTTYTVSDLANGYEHSFLVQAKVGGRWSSFGPANLVKATPEGAMRPSVSAEPADRSVALTWDPVPGAERYAVAVREGSGWRTFTYDCRGTSYTATGLSNGTEYEFLVQALCMGRWSSFGEGDVAKVKTPGTKIMGSSDASIEQMTALFYASGHEYPAAIYSPRGASTIEDFCQIVYEESAAEGVKAEVLFSQAMVETGWLQFGGSVRAEQCNFGGLGAVSNSVAGASFPNVRIGLRAQVQHLKAYASNDPLNNSCVDPRFQFVKRDIAPTVEDLNGRWAVPGTGYGQSITSLVERMLNL